MTYKNYTLLYLVLIALLAINRNVMADDAVSQIPKVVLGEKITDKSIEYKDTITKVVFNINLDVVDGHINVKKFQLR